MSLLGGIRASLQKLEQWRMGSLRGRDEKRAARVLCEGVSGIPRPLHGPAGHETSIKYTLLHQAINLRLLIDQLRTKSQLHSVTPFSRESIQHPPLTTHGVMLRSAILHI